MLKSTSDSSLIPLRRFLRDFAAFAGAKGLKALLFILLGAIVDGVGLVLLIPFFSVIIDSPDSNSNGATQNAIKWLFAWFSVESRPAKLALVLAFFSVLMIARAVVVIVRDVTMTQLQIGFSQQMRVRMTRHLAAAPWDAVSRLRHSRITHLMSADIQQLEGTTFVLMRDAVAAVMLASQIVLAFLLAPLLRALALGVVLLSFAALLPMVKRARRIGRVTTNVNLSLIDDVTQFLGALKLAISQNLQERFTNEFEATLGELRAQQIRYVREQTISRIAVTTGSSFVGVVAILLGVVVFDISASVLITLLLILSRMNGPATQLQGDAQHIAQALPAYEKIRELERDLAAAERVTVVPLGPSVLADGPIVFRGVSFLHGAGEEASSARCGVQDVDLIIAPRSIVGITGPSGAGKTTFADLLVGLYPPHCARARRRTRRGGGRGAVPPREALGWLPVPGDRLLLAGSRPRAFRYSACCGQSGQPGQFPQEVGLSGDAAPEPRTDGQPPQEPARSGKHPEIDGREFFRPTLPWPSAPD